MSNVKMKTLVQSDMHFGQSDNTKAQAENAITWIDALPSYKQAPMGKRENMGDAETGFCCLGVGCHVLSIPYNKKDGASEQLKSAVGLLTPLGHFLFSKDCLSSINDATAIGFNGISEIMKENPHWMFEHAVADLIKEHYQGDGK